MRVLFCSTRAVAVTAGLISMFRTKRTTLFCENICCLEVSFSVSCIRISYIIVCSSHRSLCPTTIGPVFLKIYEQISHYNTTVDILCNCLKINGEIFKVVLDRLWLYPSLYLYFLFELYLSVKPELSKMRAHLMQLKMFCSIKYKNKTQ